MDGDLMMFAAPTERSGRFPEDSPVKSIDTRRNLAIVKTGPNDYEVGCYDLDCIDVYDERRNKLP